MTPPTATPAASARPVHPLPGPLDAVVRVPGSKSITNRALLVAALADGPSTLSGVLDAEDTAAMTDCLRRLDVIIEHGPGEDTVVVHGTGGRLPAGPAVRHLDARQSGTTARFLAPALALGSGRYRLDGDPQLRSRPFAPLFVALRRLGVQVDASGHDTLPVELSGRRPRRLGRRRGHLRRRVEPVHLRSDDGRTAEPSRVAHPA